jgi:hypothetical protein
VSRCFCTGKCHDDKRKDGKCPGDPGCIVDDRNHLSDLCCAATPDHVANLLAERVDAAGCPVVVLLNKWEMLDAEARAELRAQVRAGCENRPGVYRMIGPADNLLYVGKSIRVRTRLLSYFRAPRGEKAAEIISHTHRIEWEYTPSEFASLLTEMRSIQEARPPYNVEHKRDRAFCFIKLTREEAPRILAVQEVADDGALYFGPFRGRARVREALREVADLLELRTCAAATPMRFADQLDMFGVDPQPLCMRADAMLVIYDLFLSGTNVDTCRLGDGLRQPVHLVGEVACGRARPGPDAQ